MKAVSITSLKENGKTRETFGQDQLTSYPTLDTIRLRVKKIRSSWTPEEQKARRLEGQSRRDRLEELLFGRRLSKTAREIRLNIRDSAE